MQTDVLIIDSDLGFVFWLGHAFDEAGYRAFPARNVSDAMTLARELDIEPGLVIMGDAQPGAGKLIARWRTRHPELRVVWLTENGAEKGSRGGPQDRECRKPALTSIHGITELLLGINEIVSSREAPEAMTAGAR
jgi:hypothetical protein